MLTRPTRRQRPKPRDIWHMEVSADLGREIRELAEREHRSLSAQVQLLLRRALATETKAAA
jgi:hypothetical protein